jgi:hypothetical protein
MPTSNTLTRPHSMEPFLLLCRIVPKGFHLLIRNKHIPQVVGVTNKPILQKLHSAPVVLQAANGWGKYLAPSNQVQFQEREQELEESDGESLDMVLLVHDVAHGYTPRGLIDVTPSGIHGLYICAYVI